jgi:tetratricopeptide (TPR) repeat protein
MNQVAKPDPVRAHREGTALYDSGNYKQALDKFLKASQLYREVGDFFDSCYTLFKAAECSFLMKDYQTALERFLESADMMLERAYDRFGLGALEYARDCYKALGEEEGKKVTGLKKRIAGVKKKLEAQAL